MRICTALALGAATLSGCVQTTSKVAVAPSTDMVDAIKVERVAGANIAAAPLFLLSLEGLPPQVTTSLATRLQNDMTARQIVLTGQTKAKYLARGYFSAFTAGENSRFVYVWDVADTAKHTRQRVTDAIIVKGTAPEPWTLFSNEVLAEISAKSADDLAAVLSNTAEAQKTK